jgi:hypothetical protein
VERSAVLAVLPWKCFSTERTRISYLALPATASGAVSRKGNRMKSINATVLDRKSGGAQWRDLRFSGPFLGMFFDRGIMGLRPTQGDEKRLLSINCSAWRHRPPLVISTEPDPDFLLRSTNHDCVCGFFSKKAAWSCSTPPISTGNPGYVGRKRWAKPNHKQSSMALRYPAKMIQGNDSETPWHR